MADVLLHPDVDAWLQDQQPDIEARVRSRLEAAGERPEHYLKRLSGRDEYRLRAGDYRCIIDWDRSRDELRVLEVGHRRNVYE